MGREVLLGRRLERYVHLDEVNHAYLAWQLEQLAPVLGQRILEVGCGVGGVTQLLLPRERLVGVDIDPETASHAARRFADRPECRFVSGDITALPRETAEALRAERFDTIVAINVLPQISDDLGALRAMAELVEPGGHLALIVPAHSWLYGRYDALDGIYRRYSCRQLRILLGHTPFAPLSVRYFNFAAAIGWFVQYRLVGREAHGQTSFGVMNALIPVLRRLEGFVAPPFGLSVVATCRREGAVD